MFFDFFKADQNEIFYLKIIYPNNTNPKKSAVEKYNFFYSLFFLVCFDPNEKNIYIRTSASIFFFFTKSR